ncbi:MAG: DsbE family thiol:disulfide interchange protein, partial [Pseudomonadota bacterium]
LLQPVKGVAQTRVDQTLIKGPALINFWATWCPSCYEEHADLMRLTQQGVTIYGVNYRDDRAEAIQFLSRLGNPFKANFFDEKADIGFEFGVTGAPETFFVDSQGLVQYRHVGVISSKNWNESLRAVYEGMK